MTFHMAFQPQFVNIELTLGCNLRCLHCGSTAGKPRNDELERQEWISLVKELTELGCREICILGGEPFLAKDWLYIAQSVCDSGMDLVIITNGWCMDQPLVRKLKTLSRLDRIGVSLDAASPRVHDYIRGRGDSFRRAHNALWMLRDAGFEVGAITSVSKLNLSELPGLRDLLLEQDITWQIQSVVAHGKRWSDQWNLTPEQHYQVAEFISKSRKTSGVDNLPVAGSHCFGYFSERLTGYTEVPVWPGWGASRRSGECSSGL